MSADPDSSETRTGGAGSNPASAVDKRTLQAELAGERDRYLRLAADFDNFRRRTAREAERSAATQKEAFIRDLLPVIDNLERALGSDVSTSPRTTPARRPADPPTTHPTLASPWGRTGRVPRPAIRPVVSRSGQRASRPRSTRPCDTGDLSARLSPGQRSLSAS